MIYIPMVPFIYTHLNVTNVARVVLPQIEIIKKLKHTFLFFKVIITNKGNNS